MDLDPDPGGIKTCGSGFGSGSAALLSIFYVHCRPGACITYKDDAGGPGLGRLEEVPDPPGALTHQHLVKLGARGVEEWNAGLARYSAAKRP
jgi:hypothetical protein